MVDQKSTFFVFFIIFLFIKSTFEQASSSSVEKSALLELRSSLGLRSRDWPVKGDPCLNWNGVKCNKNGNVTSINISRFRRTRIGNRNPKFSVDSLVNLTSLVSFNASRFSLPGSIPIWFGSLKTLEVLDLSSCFISGTIPVSIGLLSNLQSLNLSSNGLSSSIPLSLGDISGLVDLDLSFNDLTGSVPSELKELRKLQTFVIAGNRFSGSLPSDLFSFLSKVQIIDFRGNGFIGGLPSGLWLLREIKILDFSGNNFSDTLPPDITIDSSVLMLNISGNMFYGNLSGLLRRFRVLDLSRNYFEGKCKTPYF